MTKRIDFLVSRDGTVHWNYIPTEFTEMTEGEDIILQTKNWDITLNLSTRRIKIHSSSNAKKKRRDFSIYMRSGTLFLYNSTTDWYWYWRNQNLQTILDHLEIDKISTLKSDTLDIEIIFHDIDGVPTPITSDKQNTLKIYPSDTDISFSPKYYILGEENNCIIASAKIKPKDYVLISSSDGYKILYIQPNLKVEDILSNDLENINLVYPDLERKEIYEFIRRNRDKINPSRS